MDYEPGTLKLDKAEAELLLEFVARAIGRKRTKPGTVEYRVHQKVWDAWSDLNADKREPGLAVDIEDENQYLGHYDSDI